MLSEVEAMLLRKLPEKIELVGGPYCGVFVYTRKGRASDVYAEQLGVKSTVAISSWAPVSTREIHLVRPGIGDWPGEVCIYKPQRDGRWLFSGARVVTDGFR